MSNEATGSNQMTASQIEIVKTSGPFEAREIATGKLLASAASASEVRAILIQDQGLTSLNDLSVIGTELDPNYLGEQDGMPVFRVFGI